MIVVGAYVALPFRKAGGDPDGIVEAWVRQVRAGGIAPRRAEESPQRTEGRTRRRHRTGPGSEAAQYAEAEEINFCPKCGRRAGPDDRFCAGCGRPLREGGG
jgi:hypothetical protein